MTLLVLVPAQGFYGEPCTALKALVQDNSIGQLASQTVPFQGMNAQGKAITQRVLFRWEYNNKCWWEPMGDGEGGREAARADSRHCLLFVNVIF